MDYNISLLIIDHKRIYAMELLGTAFGMTLKLCLYNYVYINQFSQISKTASRKVLYQQEKLSLKTYTKFGLVKSFLQSTLQLLRYYVVVVAITE